MKQKLLKNITGAILIASVIICGLQSCNKEIPGAVPITTVQNSITINGFLTSDTSFSLFNAAVIKAGAAIPSLADSNNSVTVFAPNNAAFKPFLIAVSGGSLNAASANSAFITFINGPFAASAVSIVSYLVIPGHEFIFSEIPTTFPNFQLPSALGLGANLPGTPVPLKNSVFLSKRGNLVWFNTVPVTTFDAHYRNGIVHVISGIPTPPSATLKTLINADPNLTYFSAAVIRGDSGQVGTNRIDSLLNYAVTNMTVFAPNDNAFKAVLFAQIYAGLIAQGVPPATATTQATALSSSPTVFSNPALYGTLTAAKVQGIVVYHFLATLTGATYQPNIRVFSVNFPNTASSYKTLVNNGLSIHPGVTVQSYFATSGLSVDSLKVTGFANGGVPATSRGNAGNLDKHAVNGVYHVIDGVLLPQ